MHALIIYQFCTFGGVERVILNRADAFRRYNQDVKLTVGYLYDSGALESFQAYIHDQKLSEYLSAKVINEEYFLGDDHYDYYFVIDTPQILDKIANKENVFLECHTHYQDNRQYLRDVPENIRGIFVPSKSFRSLIINEFPNLPPVSVLPHPIPEVFYEAKMLAREKVFTRRPLAYFGRLDELKNFSEANKIFDLFLGDETIMYIIIGYGADDEALIQSLAQKNMLRKTLLRGNLGFNKAPQLINVVKQHRGVFISPSKGESFGLSAAEFMCGGVPVLLSDIPAHRELVENDGNLLYPLGDLQNAKAKLLDLFDQWEEMSDLVDRYAKKFQGKAFIEAWQGFFET